MIIPAIIGLNNPLEKTVLRISSKILRKQEIHRIILTLHKTKNLNKSNLGIYYTK